MYQGCPEWQIPFACESAVIEILAAFHDHSAGVKKQTGICVDDYHT